MKTPMEIFFPESLIRYLPKMPSFTKIGLVVFSYEFSNLTINSIFLKFDHPVVRIQGDAEFFGRTRVNFFINTNNIK